MTGNGYNCSGTIPGSVYSFLLENQLMENPHYRDNELKATEIMDHEYAFTRQFDYIPEGVPVLLCCDGLDTLCDIYLNGRHIAYTDNMHRAYEFEVTDKLASGMNELRLVFHPADAYIKEKLQEGPIFGASESMQGFGNLRKAHCMFGWDWGPRLPDAGIWKDIYLLKKDSARILDIRLDQHHEENKVFVTPVVKTDAPAQILISCTAPDGNVFSLIATARMKLQILCFGCLAVWVNNIYTPFKSICWSRIRL